MQCQHQLPLPLLSPLSPGLTPAWPSTWASSWLRQKSGQTCLNTCPLFRRCIQTDIAICFHLNFLLPQYFPLNRAAALPLSLGLALLPPFRVWALAWQKHRWRITKNILKKSKSMLEVNHGVRQVVLCKDGDGKIGLRVKAVNKGSTRFGSRLLSLVSRRCVCLSCHQGLSSCPWRPQVWRPTPPGGRRQPGWILIWQGALLSVYI